MNEPLYFEVKPPAVEKLAFEARLSDNADTWPREVYDELLKQNPFLGVYDISPIMTEVNGDRGTGIGYFQVTNKSATAALGPGGNAMRAIQGVKTIKVPIVIKDSKLCPLDIMMVDQPGAEGKAYPLNERRVREAMHRPQLFDAVKKTPGDVSIVDQMYPPTARQRGLQAGQVVDAPQTKISSLQPQFLLEAIAPTILQGDLEKFASELENDDQLTAALTHNEATLPALQFLGGVETVTAEDVEKLASAHRVPNVIQVSRDGERYLLKMAKSDEFDPDVIEADRPTMAEMAGEDMVEAADANGAKTVTTDPVVRDKLEDDEVSVVERFGQYKVKTSDGKELLGWVFPVVLDFDGTALTMTLFTNGSNSAVQSQIAGSLVGKGANIIRGKPEGYGFFYRVTASGSVIAFIPTEITGKMADEGGEGYMAKTMMDEPVTIRFAPGLREIARTGEGEVTLPTDVRWAPLADAVPLLEDPSTFAKVAALKDINNTVRIISDRTTWSFQGGAGLNKVAHRWREGLTGENAMFMACCLGMDEVTAARALVKAANDGSHEVRGCRPIGLRQEKLASAREHARELWDALPPRHILLKEAAGLQDLSTVDHILSIGFLNPENVRHFIKHLPKLDDSSSRLAELLGAVRMGLADPPEDSVKSAMERLEEVIEGLQKLVHRSTMEKSSSDRRKAAIRRLLRSG